MRSLHALAVSVSICAAAAAGEDADYRTVAVAREKAASLGTDDARTELVKAARTFLNRHPSGPRADRVALWLGDALKEAAPREALQAYERSHEPAAEERLRDLVFRHEPPPRLDCETWVGEARCPRESCDEVSLFVFFSMTHPQTKRVLARMVELHDARRERGLAVVGLAAVVDDHENQRPDALEARVRELALPFPVAIDAQRGAGASVCLRRYRGERLPWAVILDRYGRIAWLDGFPVQGNGAALVERTLERLLAEPTYEQLEQALRGPDVEAALDRLQGIRTAKAARILLHAPQTERATAILEDLLPPGWLDGGLAAARERFEKTALRYDFRADRLVPEG